MRKKRALNRTYPRYQPTRNRQSTADRPKGIERKERTLRQTEQ